MIFPCLLPHAAGGIAPGLQDLPSFPFHLPAWYFFTLLRVSKQRITSFIVKTPLWLDFRIFTSTPGGAEPCPPYDLPCKKGKPSGLSTAPSIDGNCSKATGCKPDTPYQAARSMTARRRLSVERQTKHRFQPKIRCRKHQTHPHALFFPLSFPRKGKDRLPEARQNDHDGTNPCKQRLLILCARFFLSKPQTEFAVWFF